MDTSEPQLLALFKKAAYERLPERLIRAPLGRRGEGQYHSSEKRFTASEEPQANITDICEFLSELSPSLA